MFSIQSKCNTYDTIVQEQKRISVLTKALLFSSIVAFIIAIIMFFKKNTTISVLMAIIGITCFVMRSIKNTKFLKNNDIIVEKYLQYYGCDLRTMKYTTYLSDNQNRYTAAIKTATNGQGILIVYNEKDGLSFISKNFLSIKDYKKYNQEYINCLDSDFGKINLLYSNIDSYRADTNSCVLVAGHENDILRINFKDSAAFDTLIPQYEFYYKVAKKDTISK